MNVLITLLIGNLSAGDRMKIMTICTIDVHARDVVAKMIAAKVRAGDGQGTAGEGRDGPGAWHLVGGLRPPTAAPSWEATPLSPPWDSPLHWRRRGREHGLGPGQPGDRPAPVALQVESSQAFTWQSQLRHRWDEEKRHCFANICDAQIQYSYEYLGNTPRLVITPLTDRCGRPAPASRGHRA